MEVDRPLQQNNLKLAKQKVAMIVGRDVTNLDKQGVARATVETVAENLVDGVISPLFYAALGGAPLAMAFKMINCFRMQATIATLVHLPASLSR